MVDKHDHELLPSEGSNHLVVKPVLPSNRVWCISLPFGSRTPVRRKDERGERGSGAASTADLAAAVDALAVAPVPAGHLLHRWSREANCGVVGLAKNAGCLVQ